MMSQEPLNAPNRSWTVSGQLQDVPIHVSGDHPIIRTLVEEFVTPMVGRDGHPSLDVLEFSLTLLDGEPDRSRPAGLEAPIQFANVSCFQKGSVFSFHTKDGSVLEADVAAGRAWGHLSETLLEAPRYTFTDLLMAPLMEMLKQRGFYGLHAAALAKEEAGYLFPGGAESGKTTIALSLVKREFRYLADDKVLLRKEDGDIAALAFTRRFNIDPDIGRHYQELRFLKDLEPLPGIEKRPYDISRVYPNAFVSSCRPTFLIHLERTEASRSEIARLSSHESFTRLLHQTILSFHRPVAAQQLKLFADLARGTKSYLLHLGDDLYGAPERLLDLLPPS
ncbi:MAG: hypothetical protein ACE5H5_05800 [Nitrospinota bacterium]